jgi:hypothetical protein
VEFSNRIASLEEIARQVLKKKAYWMLNPPVGFMGIRGMRRLAADITNWEKDLSPEQMKRCLSDLVTFTCSVVPMPPQRLLPFTMNHVDSHQAVRDRFSSALIDFGVQFNEPTWSEAAGYLAESGRLISQLTDLFVDQLLESSFDLRPASQLITRIAEKEENAYTMLK